MNGTSDWLLPRRWKALVSVSTVRPFTVCEPLIQVSQAYGVTRNVHGFAAGVAVSAGGVAAAVCPRAGSAPHRAATTTAAVTISAMPRTLVIGPAPPERDHFGL